MKFATPLPAMMLSLLRLLCLSSFCLAGSRLLYEWLFPHWLWLGRPFPVILLTLLLAGGLYLLLGNLSPFLLLPLLLNWPIIASSAVDLVASRFLFLAALWLTAVLISHHRRQPSPAWFGPLFLLAGLLPIYLLTMPHAVGRADTFEFQVVAPQLGIAHPTGYPLYLLLAKFFSLLPVGTVAWRINLASAVFTLAALIIIYQSLLKQTKQPLPALLGASAIGLTPTLWSQAIEAEVYALHALIVALALWLILQIGDWVGRSAGRQMVGLAFVIGLGLTNHLTTAFLVPAAMLASLINVFRYGWLPAFGRLLPKLLLALLLPLLLYAYLPIRWAAVNEDVMGFGRFVDWVVGGRFQDALQWSAWRSGLARYAVIGRLFLNDWGYFNLGLAGFGFVYLLRRQWHTAVLLFITWFGFSFYALSYYIPDISVFLIPAHIVIGMSLTMGLLAIGRVGQWLAERWQGSCQQAGGMAFSLLAMLLLLPSMLAAIGSWRQLDRSADDGLTQWGTAVLNLPLATNAAILADSEKIAPLYYLQRAEGVRPDLDIMVLPDEAAYRAELNGRMAHQTVYLARFLPGLEGIYHLRSVGPLTEVSQQPLLQLPAGATAVALNFGAVDLLGYQLAGLFADGQTAVTLYWRANEPQQQLQHVYLRWQGSQVATTGQHPVGNNYPTLAWKGSELVADFHLLPNPLSSQVQRLGLEVAFGPPFAPPSELEWQLVAMLDVAATEGLMGLRPLRIYQNGLALTGVHFPATIRPQTPLPVILAGYGHPQTAAYELVQANGPGTAAVAVDAFSGQAAPFVTQVELATDLANGRYQLIAKPPEGAICGWLQPAKALCVLGQVEISGVPLPADATNYEDKIALLGVDIANRQLHPGGQLSLTLHWQSLATMARDYTIFIQVLNEQDQIVGQVDAWPLQGTLPTSQWSPGTTIADPHTLQLAEQLPSGSYRLIIGWYLLADASRLAVLNEAGLPVDDKLLIPDLFVP